MVRIKNSRPHVTQTGRRTIIAAVVSAAGLLASCFERTIQPSLGDLFFSLAAVDDAIGRGYPSNGRIKITRFPMLCAKPKKIGLKPKQPGQMMLRHCADCDTPVNKEVADLVPEVGTKPT